MTISRQDIEEGAAWARKLLHKPEQAPEVKTPVQRRAAWLKEQAEIRAGGEKPIVRGATVEQTRRDLATPGSAFTVGAERYAADGSRWQRVA